MKEGFKNFAKKTFVTVGTTAILITNAAKATTADLLAKIKDKKIDFTEKVADNTKVTTTDLKMVMAHNDKNVWIKSPEYLDGNPPLKIGNITIDEGNIDGELEQKLGMYGMKARLFENDILNILKSEHKEKYIKIIELIDGIVTKGNMSDKEGWMLLFKLTNKRKFFLLFSDDDSKLGNMFRKAIKGNEKLKEIIKLSIMINYNQIDESSFDNFIDLLQKI